jgi:hypothetical protein
VRHSSTSTAVAFGKAGPAFASLRREYYASLPVNSTERVGTVDKLDGRMYFEGLNYDVLELDLEEVRASANHPIDSTRLGEFLAFIGSHGHTQVEFIGMEVNSTTTEPYDFQSLREWPNLEFLFRVCIAKEDAYKWDLRAAKNSNLSSSACWTTSGQRDLDNPERNIKFFLDLLLETRSEQRC